MALVGLAYLVILGGSFARAPWAPHLSLPGIGSITPPVQQAAPPSLGAQALSTPAPIVPAGPGTAPPARGPAQGGGTPGGSRTNSPTTTTTAAPSASSTTTTFAPPGQTRRSTTTTTTATTQAGSTTTSTHGRPSTTTTTNPHRRAVAQP
jgi:hypothetical protein